MTGLNMIGMAIAIIILGTLFYMTRPQPMRLSHVLAVLAALASMSLILGISIHDLYLSDKGSVSDGAPAPAPAPR